MIQPEMTDQEAQEALRAIAKRPTKKVVLTVSRNNTDTMIIQQMASVDAANILVVADDTNVFWAPMSRCAQW